MSTATQNPTASALSISYSFSTRARIAYNIGTTEEESWERKEVSEKEAQEIEKVGTFTFKGKVYPAVVEGYQSFKEPSANSLEGIQKLVPDENEVVNLFSSGLSVKLGNKKRARLMATDDDGNYTHEFSEEPFDLTPDAAVPTNRRLTEDEKLTKTLGEIQLSPEKIQELMAVLAAKMNAATSGQAALQG